MIKTEDGVVDIKGNIPDLMTDMSIIIMTLNKKISEKTDEEFAKKSSMML